MPNKLHCSYDEAKRAVLTLANLCAPNGNVQQAFGNFFRDTEKSNDFDEQFAIKTAVGMVYDGLAYGNWIGDYPYKENK